MKLIADEFRATDPIHLSQASYHDPLVFLGHEIYIDSKNRLIISQRTYVRTVLERFNISSPLTTLRPEDFTPAVLTSGTPLSEADHSLFRSKLGSASYLSQGTRVELLSPISMLAEYQSQPTDMPLSAFAQFSYFFIQCVSRN